MSIIIINFFLAKLNSLHFNQEIEFLKKLLNNAYLLIQQYNLNNISKRIF